MPAEETPLFILPDGVETRWASPENPEAKPGAGGRANAGRKGSAYFPLKAGEKRLLARAEGTSGTVRRIWVTINDRSPAMLRGLRLDFFWDGAPRPAASVPLGDFFGVGLGRTAAFESALFASPEGRSFESFVPMPFREEMRIFAANESGRRLDAFFYDVDFTVGDHHGGNALYFHAFWRRENPTSLKKDYEILPAVKGKGRFLGMNAGIIADRALYTRSWWGEGEVKVYIDGDRTHPTLCGTGTEDYIGTGWSQGRFAQSYTGCPVADKERMSYCFYRYHVPDPVFFHKRIRVTIQQIGCWDPETRFYLHGTGKPLYAAGTGRKRLDLSAKSNVPPYGIFERRDDWSSCAYFYLDRPESGLPALAPAGERMAGLDEGDGKP